jgi:hypothetical protein
VQEVLRRGRRWRMVTPVRESRRRVLVERQRQGWCGLVRAAWKPVWQQKRAVRAMGLWKPERLLRRP